MEKITLTPLELSQMIGVSRETVYRLVREDKVPHTKVRGSILFHRDVIDSWLRGEYEEETVQSV